MQACIGLGSNRAEPKMQLVQAARALAALDQTRLLACSRLYRSPPWGEVLDQPDYLNAVLLLDTRLSPYALLCCLQGVEQKQGRNRSEEQHWGPRTLDLDLLLYGALQLYGPRLTLPHPWLEERDFVLAPLSELVPEWLLADGRSVACVWGDWQASHQQSAKALIETVPGWCDDVAQTEARPALPL